MKNLLHQRFSNSKAPEYLVNNIRNQIFKPLPARKISEPFQFIQNFFKDKYAFALLLIISFVILVSLPFAPDLSPEALIHQQKGDNNMLIQAHSNFHKIVEGELKVQFADKNPKSISNFFESNGVSYSTIIPECPSWEVIGAIISESDGEKLAHTLFRNEENEILYLYQANENIIKRKLFVNISDDLIQYLSEGNLLKINETDCQILMMKCKNNFIAIASNSLTNNLENSFLAYMN
ncbi:MAG: hypothetical protein RDU14_10495 [Melioribacteraceae bacterium]|nr:hypothetical protein [Melioribacteraceae bacterium]